MTATRKGQLTASPCRFCRPGAWVEQDGITFSAAVPSEENVNLILYPRGERRDRPGDSLSQTALYRDCPHHEGGGDFPGEYEYNFRIGDRVTVDPAAHVVRGRDVFGDAGPRANTRCGEALRRKTLTGGRIRFPWRSPMRM